MRGPVKQGFIDVRVRCLVQDNGDGTVTVSVPRLSHGAWTGKTDAEARMLALRALDDREVWGEHHAADPAAILPHHTNAAHEEAECPNRANLE